MSKIKEGIDFVFKQNPELEKIGSQEDYSQYLETIFPESKIRDIVYHRTSQKFEKFDKSKIKNTNGNRFYFSPINTGRYGKHVMQAILNIKNLAIPYDDDFIQNVNKKHPEYSKGKNEWFYLPAQIYVNANKYGYDGVFAFEGTNDDEYSVYNPSQIHILGSKKDIEGFKKYVKEKQLKKDQNKFSSKSLESKVVEGIFGISFLASLFFISYSITGNAISNFAKIIFNPLGILLFVGSIAGLFIHLKFKKRK